MQYRTFESNVVELENRLIVLAIEDCDSKTIKHLDQMLRDRGSKHTAIVAIHGGSIESIDADSAKKLLNHIIAQEGK